MEEKILKKLTASSRILEFKAPFDGRWGLSVNPAGKKWQSRNVKGLRGMVWHQEMGWGSVESVADYHTGKKSHLAKGGVESIAYTFAIRRNGQIVLCNDIKKSTWSQGYAGRKGDENAEFISVMFEGLFNGEGMDQLSAGEPNYRQMLSALSLWHICKNEWDWDDGDLQGHHLFGKPACPGNTLKVMIDAIRVNREKRALPLFSTIGGRQQALKDLGYYKEEIDGIWGPGSKSALTCFQQKNGLEVDGIWGEKTEAMIIAVVEERMAG